MHRLRDNRMFIREFLTVIKVFSVLYLNILEFEEAVRRFRSAHITSAVVKFKNQKLTILGPHSVLRCGTGYEES